MQLCLLLGQLKGVGFNSTVLSTKSLEHAGHVPATPLVQMRSRRGGSGTGARSAPCNSPAAQGEGLGGMDVVGDAWVIHLTGSPEAPYDFHHR